MAPKRSSDDSSTQQATPRKSRRGGKVTAPSETASAKHTSGSEPPSPVGSDFVEIPGHSDEHPDTSDTMTSGSDESSADKEASGAPVYGAGTGPERSNASTDDGRVETRTGGQTTDTSTDGGDGSGAGKGNRIEDDMADEHGDGANNVSTTSTEAASATPAPAEPIPVSSPSAVSASAQSASAQSASTELASTPTTSAEPTSTTPGAGTPPVPEGTNAEALGVILKSCTVVTNHSGGVPGRIAVANINAAFRGREDKRARITTMLGMPGSHADAVNLAVANASLFNGRPRYVTTFDRPPATAVFSMYGVLTYNGLIDAADNRGRQVCLAPFDVGLSHALAVLRHLGEQPYFYVQSFRRGVSISTGQFNSRPGDDFSVFRSVLTRDSPVPVFDGRDRFFWSKYRELPPMSEDDIEKGMVCAVLFTINFYGTSAKETISKKVVPKTAGLNLQAVVVLDDKNPHATANMIGSHDIPLSDDVQPDYTNLTERAINLNAVIQAPVSVPNSNEVMV